jgi:hypothetical protein
MFRRSLFLGLTVLLAAVLITLVIKGRRQEINQAKASRIVEVVKEFKPSATRVMAPPDLGVIWRVEGQGGASQPESCVIRNHGTTAYANPDLQVALIASDGRVLAQQTMRIDAAIQPGQEVIVQPSVIDPALKAVRTQLAGKTVAKPAVRIRSAELSPGSGAPEAEHK